MAGPSRILVYGVYGSGKSTLAEELARRLGLPWHPVDDLTWEPGWVEVPTAVQRQRIGAICRQRRWILDGAYGPWLDLPLAHADLVIGLDYPRWLSLWRLLRRTARRVVTRETICNGNHESLGSVFSTESVVVWHFGSFAGKRRRMRRWQAEPGGPPVLLFRRPADLERWLAGLGPGQP
ncbi:adenylate kinase [Polymorphospora lycopeni]|uniref:Adenylate kinase n=1 Tax=Polymorphospora lycopeni TaxID=3140240 RepID=A0ABV5CL87_9ACTN